MKNQYVGDVNDFVKYGLLHSLTGGGARSSFIAWLLTPDDDRPDGRRLAYLDTPAKWRHRDPDLFDSLQTLVQSGARSVEAVAASGILPGARFHADIVPQPANARRRHLDDTLRQAVGQELIFFDPDNGLKIASCSSDQKDSPKYLLWSELAQSYHAGHSVLIYQHFPRLTRGAYISAMSERISDETGACGIVAFRTGHVAFFLAPQPSQAEYYADRAKIIAERWKDVILPVLTTHDPKSSSKS